MTDLDDAEAAAPASEPAAPDVPDSASSEVLFGQGQAAWLAVVTLISVLALAIAFVALFEVNSGGGSGDGGGAPTGPTTELAVEMSDFAFAPDRAEVVADESISLELSNVGGVEHNWTVLSERISAEADFDESLVLFGSADLAAGESGSESFQLAAGDYQIICTVSGHFDLGMEGSVSAR